jgi:hypothetical protein
MLNFNTKKITKQEYNRMYYQKNKAKWIERKKPFHPVLQLFSKASQSSKQPKLTWVSFWEGLEIWVFFSLAILMTCFLIHEAAYFYLDAQESPLFAYFKAGILEGLAILFSFSRGNSKLLRGSQKLGVILLCSFTLWVMSGKIVKTAVGDTLKVQTLQKNLQQLEAELAQKEHLRNQFLNRGWLTLTRRYERGIDPIRNRIHSTRQEILSLQSPEMILNHSSILIAFRILLVLANLICIHRLAEQIRKKTSIFGQNSTSFQSLEKLNWNHSTEFKN